MEDFIQSYTKPTVHHGMHPDPHYSCRLSIVFIEAVLYVVGIIIPCVLLVVAR